MAVSKRLRFEVLRRDNHTCRYCGRAAPEVRITVDHVVAVALGGSDDPENLVAACSECNAGKSSVPADAGLIEDVAADAMRWARALETAAEIHRNDSAKKEQDDKDFVWDVVNDGPGGKILTHIDRTYSLTILRFRDLGLNLKDLHYALEKVPTHRLFGIGRWKYFCGVCWSMIRERQEIARGLVDSEVAE